MIFFKKIKYNKLSDSELVHQYSESGNTEFVGELFTRYSHLVYGVCLLYLKNRSDAKDAVLSIFEKLITDLKKHKISNFKNWLHSVSRNYCLIQIRGKNRATLRETIFSNEHENETISTFEYEINKNDEEFKEVHNAIQELKAEQKICIELFFLQQKSYAEIIETTGFSSDQVKSYIQNGKRNLKNILITKP